MSQVHLEKIPKRLLAAGALAESGFSVMPMGLASCTDTEVDVIFHVHFHLFCKRGCKSHSSINDTNSCNLIVLTPRVS